MYVAEVTVHVSLVHWVGLLLTLLQGIGGQAIYQTYPYNAWSSPIKAGTCSSNRTPMEIKILPKTGSTPGIISCALEDGVKAYRYPVGIFEIDEQLLIPEKTKITGSRDPNDMFNPTTTPDWKDQTLFLATRGATDYNMNYCYNHDMVKTRMGFVLSSYVTVTNVSYQGIDTIRPGDNGALCGGGVFETKGCALNDCSSDVNNGGSDGIGSVHVTIENVRLNDYYYNEDKNKIGASIAGNYECNTNINIRGRPHGQRLSDHGFGFEGGCCFCKPNGVRTSQVGVWVPQSRNAGGTSNIFVNNVVSSSTQADGINLHGNVSAAFVSNTYIQNTGDDTYALWGANLNPTNVTFKNCKAVNPGILRPNWYGNCVATYGLKSVVFDNLDCRAPTLEHPLECGGGIEIDTSVFVFYSSFSAKYPNGNNITINGWTFKDLQGNIYTLANGTMDKYKPGKMVWTKAQDGAVAPFYIPNRNQEINVYAA